MTPVSAADNTPESTQTPANAQAANETAEKIKHIIKANEHLHKGEKKEAIDRLVPAGWGPTQSVQGDLNGDGMADLVAVLMRDDSPNGSTVEQEGSQGLLVLFADPSGGYRYQDFAPEALPCATCLGALGGNPNAALLALAVADQKLTVGWREGSRGSIEVKLIVGQDRERGMMRLLRDETVTTDRSAGKVSSLSRDYLAGVVVTDGRESNISPKFIPLIEVSAEDY